MVNSTGFVILLVEVFEGGDPQSNSDRQLEDRKRWAEPDEAADTIRRDEVTSTGALQRAAVTMVRCEELRGGGKNGGGLLPTNPCQHPPSRHYPHSCPVLTVYMFNTRSHVTSFH